jgi:hypothetical protein
MKKDFFRRMLYFCHLIHCALEKANHPVLTGQGDLGFPLKRFEDQTPLNTLCALANTDSRLRGLSPMRPGK